MRKSLVERRIATYVLFVVVVAAVVGLAAFARDAIDWD